MCYNPITITISISIHAPTWGATIEFRLLLNDWTISIHAPTWGATVTVKVSPPLLYFNPRTHVGCDEYVVTKSRTLAISIHAPTWGATELLAK